MRPAAKTIPWAVMAALSCLFAQQPNAPAPIPPGTSGPDGAYRVGNGVTPPIALTRVPGALPDLARQVRASGEVLVSVVVQADGGLRDLQIVRSAGYGMDEKAIEAVRKWRFRAGMKNGQPVDVRINVEISFRVTSEKNTWGAGPLIFDVPHGVKPPVLKSGSMPKAVRQSGNETVVLQFTVNTRGEVDNVHVVQGEDSPSVPVLQGSISKWKFEPASDGTTALGAGGKVLLIKGEDQFRYEVSSAFRNTGNPEPRASVPSTTAGRPPIIRVVPVSIRLEPEEANRQLVHRIQPAYPPEAKAAGIEGTVVLEVTIGADGNVSSVREIAGPAELVPAAVAAVKQWQYRPFIYRGLPRQAVTEVEIEFKSHE